MSPESLDPQKIAATIARPIARLWIALGSVSRVE